MGIDTCACTIHITIDLGFTVGCACAYTITNTYRHGGACFHTTQLAATIDGTFHRAVTYHDIR